MWKLENLNSQPMQSQRFTGSEAGRYAALSEEFWVAKKWVVMGLILHCFTKLQYFWDMFFQVYPPRLWYWGSDLDLGVIYFPTILGFKEPQNLPFFTSLSTASLKFAQEDSSLSPTPRSVSQQPEFSFEDTFSAENLEKKTTKHHDACVFRKKDTTHFSMENGCHGLLLFGLKICYFVASKEFSTSRWSSQDEHNQRSYFSREHSSEAWENQWCWELGAIFLGKKYENYKFTKRQNRF